MPKFTSVGGAASRALRDFLVQQEVARMNRALFGEDIADRQQRRALAEQAAQRAEADRLATIVGPDADLDVATADTLQKGGYRINEQQTLPARTIGADGVAAQDLPSTQYSRRQETFTERLAREQRDEAKAEKNEARRFRDEQADAERAFRGEQAEANRNASAERAQAEREMKMLIADMSRSGSAETRALANELKRLQIAQQQDKLDTAREGREKAQSDARTSTQTALDLAERLRKHPGMGKATGAYELRGFTQDAQDFNGIREQLVATLTLPNLGALKGPMSDKDVAFVKSISTRLANTRLSEAETRRAIQEAQTFLRGKLGGSGSNTAGGRRIGRFEVIE